MRSGNTARSKADSTLRFSTRRVAILLGLATVGLTAASYAMHLLTRASGADTIAALDVGDEVSLATWFGSGLFVLAAVVLVVGRQQALAAGGSARGWLSLAVVMLALSIDEAVSVHERLGSALREVLNTSGFFYYVWVFPALVFAAAVVLFQLGWLRALPRRTRTLVVLGGVVFVLGAAGLELVAGIGDEGNGTATLTSITLTAVEEFAEMAGLSLFVVALLGHLSGFRLSVDFDGPTPAGDRRR